MKEKIVLVIPNAPLREDSSKFIHFANEDIEQKFEPPLGLLYIAALLEKNGYEVEIIDNFSKRIPNDELAKIILDKKPKIVGFSLFITNYASGRELMAEIKGGNKEIIIVTGGPFSTLYPEEMISKPYVDFAVFGEGEETLLEIADKVNKKKKLGKIPGCLYKKGKKIYKNPPRPFIKNLDSLPWPAWHLVDINDYYRKKTLYLDVEPVDFICSSRGCPYQCAFCSSRHIWNLKYRYRSAKSVCDEIEYMVQKYGTKGIHFREDNFTVNRKKVMEFCEEIKKRGITVIWQCESRADTLDEELLKIMYESGCRGIWFGLESGSQEILDKLHKNLKLEQIQKAIELCHKHKIITGGSFMFGLPIENKKDVKKTFEFAKSLKLDNVIFNKYVGIPKCELYDYAKQNKLYKEEWEGMLVIETPEFSAEELEKMQSWFNNYFRLRRIKKIFKMRSIGQYPKIFIRGIKLIWDLVTKRPRFSKH